MNGMQSKEGLTGVKDDMIKEKNLQIEAMLVKMDLLKRSYDETNMKLVDA